MGAYGRSAIKLCRVYHSIHSAMIYKAMASGRFGRVMNVVATTGMPEVKGDKSGKTFDGYNDAIGEIDRIIGSQEQNKQNLRLIMDTFKKLAEQ